MATITIKQHDTKVRFRDIPTIDGVPLTAEDLAGCTLSFLLKNDSTQIKAPAVIDTDGSFYYDPIADDVADIGDFQQEWEVVYPSTKILTFPNSSYHTVKIIADLG